MISWGDPVLPRAISQNNRKQVEQPFGWGKTIGQLAKTMQRGVAKVGALFTLNMAALNLAKLPRLLAAGATGHPRTAPNRFKTTATGYGILNWILN